jgi:lysyl-tRNA synthetase class I
MTIEIDLYCSDCGRPVTTLQDRNGKWEVEWDCGCREELMGDEYKRGLEDGREEARNE